MRLDASQRSEALLANQTQSFPSLFFSSCGEIGCFFFFFFTSSIKHIWLRAVGGSRFLIHSDFFGGGCGCVEGC